MTTTLAPLESLERRVSVLPQNPERFSTAIRSYLEALDAYKAPFLQEKLAIEGTLTEPALYQEAFTEFKKFAGLIRLYRKPLAMPSDTVDAVWHQFILFTEDYKAFCDEYVGSFLHHRPNIPSRPGRREVAHQEWHNLHSLYTATWGTMPAIWRPGEQ